MRARTEPLLNYYLYVGHITAYMHNNTQIHIIVRQKSHLNCLFFTGEFLKPVTALMTFLKPFHRHPPRRTNLRIRFSISLIKNKILLSRHMSSKCVSLMRFQFGFFKLRKVEETFILNLVSDLCNGFY